MVSEANGKHLGCGPSMDASPMRVRVPSFTLAGIGSNSIRHHLGIAQLGSAPDSDSGGRRFESSYPDLGGSSFHRGSENKAVARSGLIRCPVP